LQNFVVRKRISKDYNTYLIIINYGK